MAKANKVDAALETEVVAVESVTVTAIPHSSGGFLVTEKGENGNFKEYLSETDPTVKK